MELRIKGKFSTADALIKRLDRQYAIIGVIYPEAYKYCGTYGSGTIIVKLLDIWVDFSIFREKRFAKLNIKVSKS